MDHQIEPIYISIDELLFCHYFMTVYRMQRGKQLDRKHSVFYVISDSVYYNLRPEP